MSHVTIRPGDAGSSAVARGLLAAAAELGLPADVVEWSPSLGGFKVPEEVSAAYARVEDPDPQPEPEPAELEPDGATEPAEAAGLPPANATLNIVLPVPVAQTPLSTQAPEATGQRTYSDAEKAAAVDAVVNGGRTIASVAAEMGASATSVGKWVKAASAAEGGTL